VDDNGDNLVDCQDPQCGAFSCVPMIPAGWNGPVALYDGSAANAPACNTDFPTAAYSGFAQPMATPAQCNACTCSAISGGTCLFAPQIVVGDAPCASDPTCSANLAVSDGWTGTCEVQSYFPGGQTLCGPGSNCSSNTGMPCNVSVSMAATVVTGGTCAASPGGVMAKDPVQWNAVGLACSGASQGGGCGTDGACLPSTGTAFSAGTCIQQAGEQLCPAPFTHSHIFYSSAVDTRDCSACGCGAPLGQVCSAQVTVYSATTSMCSGTPVATLAVDGQPACSNLQGNPTVGAHHASNVNISGGACPSSGGEPTGDATADSTTAVTFCCL